MKKLLSVILTISMLASLVAVSAFSTSAQSVDIADISKAIENIELSFSIEDKIASLKARTYKVSEEPQVPYTDIDGYAYGYIGDVDGDDDVTVFDATAVQLYIAQLEPLMATLQLLADIDGDGEITIMDATEIQLYAARLSDSQRIFHMLYSPFEDFDPMLDTFDDITKAVKENGFYDDTEGCYSIAALFEDEIGNQVYSTVDYYELYGDINFHSTTYDAQQDACMIVNVTVNRGSKKFNFHSFYYTEDYVFYEAEGTSELTNFTPDGYEFDTNFDSVYSEFGITSADLEDVMNSMFFVNLYTGDELLCEYIVGSTIDLVYDITKLYEFV